MRQGIANPFETMETAEEIIRHVEAALAQDDEDEAIAALERLRSSEPPNANEGRKLAILARSIDRNDLALAAIEAGPDDVEARLIAFQLRTEAGEAVADELSAVEPVRSPGPALLQLAGALDMEGRSAEAMVLLEHALRRQPDWIPAHQALAQLRWQAGEDEPTRSFREAIDLQPGNELLWASWLGTIGRTLDRELFDRVSADARGRFPLSQLIAMICADIFSEMGREQDADRLFGQLAAVSDPDFDAARMRHAMRYSRFADAVGLGERAAARHGAGECWAWLGAAWRLSGDPRSDWFHRGSELVATADLDYSAAELTSLAALLRGLHRGSGPPLGQSPRGGTQTPGPLLKRSEPEIRQFRQKIRRAVRRYIDGLPAPDPRHPFLGRRRNAFRFEGAWSIRLRPGGKHVSHIHSHGWISSAFYVDLPGGMTGAEDRQGWLQFGVPLLPEDAPIDPLKLIAPRPGRLALFPSLFWHGTKPFEKGERLTAAFDVVPR